MSRNSSGIRVGFGALVLVGAVGSAWSADAPENAATERLRLESQYALRVDDQAEPDLDPVVFTEIVPFTADENAVRLPPDQDLD